MSFFDSLTVIGEVELVRWLDIYSVYSTPVYRMRRMRRTRMRRKDYDSYEENEGSVMNEGSVIS